MAGGTELAAKQREIWDRIAPFWAEHRELAPTRAVRWTPPQPTFDVADLRVLELGCGDGRRAVQLAAAGADVLATDASSVFVELTERRAAHHPGQVSGRLSTAIIDATDSASLATLDPGFDLIIADMVLMNLVDLVPLARELPRLLARGGRFTPMVLHPCFPSPFFVDVDEAGRPAGFVSRIVGLGQRVAAHVPARAIAALSFAARPLLARPRPYFPEVTRRVAVPGQPEPHFNVHRPIGALLQPFFEVGLSLHALCEGTDDDGTEPGLLWLDLRHSNDGVVA